MRRANGLFTLTRRQVCTGVAGCVGIAAVASCIDGSTSVVQTGALGGPEGSGSGSNNPDGGMPPIDSSSHMADAASGATCPSTGATDVGAPSTFVNNTPQYFSSLNAFVVRDSGGLYAVTARCTHEGATCIVDTGEFYCPRHGATFDFNGNVLGGPVFQGLVHYAMCTLSNGHVGVIRSQTVAKTQRLVA
jgi:nitrite reductase/ring-hydroxylating ferredoxin subunit